MECQFQIGYKGIIELVYRNELVQTISAQVVYDNDQFEYELGLNARLYHKPALKDRGEAVLFYALFKLANGGYGFEVMSKEDIDLFAMKHSKTFTSEYSPWKSEYEEMAKKTAIKRVLKYAPIKAELRRAFTIDESVRTEFEMEDLMEYGSSAA